VNETNERTNYESERKRDEPAARSNEEREEACPRHTVCTGGRMNLKCSRSREREKEGREEVSSEPARVLKLTETFESKSRREDRRSRERAYSHGIKHSHHICEVSSSTAITSHNTKPTTNKAGLVSFVLPSFHPSVHSLQRKKEKPSALFTY